MEYIDLPDEDYFPISQFAIITPMAMACACVLLLLYNCVLFSHSPNPNIKFQREAGSRAKKYQRWRAIPAISPAKTTHHTSQSSLQNRAATLNQVLCFKRSVITRNNAMKRSLGSKQTASLNCSRSKMPYAASLKMTNRRSSSKDTSKQVYKVPSVSKEKGSLAKNIRKGKVSLKQKVR